jgi:serine/threonine protein kinase
MRVTEKCDIYSYGVVLLELLTGRAPVQPLELGGDLVTYVKNYIRDNSLDPGILDKKLDLQDQGVVDHMIEVLNIALLCSNLSPYERPPMRHVVVMLSESKDRTRASSASSPASDHPSKKDNS